jgi:hypothetical protein
VRQIGPHFQEPSMVVLQERLHHLENTVAALSAALQILARAVSDGAMDRPGGEPVVEAARQAKELLVSLRVPQW